MPSKRTASPTCSNCGSPSVEAISAVDKTGENWNSVFKDRPTGSRTAKAP